MPRTTTKTKPRPGGHKAKQPTKALTRKARAKRAAPQRVGHPGLLTPDTASEIVRTLAAGNYLHVAAETVGISRTTLYNWLSRGRAERARQMALESEGTDDEPVLVEVDPVEQVYVEFLNACERAEAEAETYAVLTVRDLMRPRNENGDLRDENVRLRAASTYLERKHPERWSRGERTEITMVGGERPIRVEVTDEQRREQNAEILDVLLTVGAFDVASLPAGEIVDGEVVDGDE